MFTIEEGEQYRVGTVDVRSNVRAIDPGLDGAGVLSLTRTRGAIIFVSSVRSTSQSG